MNPTDPVREERETYAERPRPDTWAATPLDPYRNAEVRQTQTAFARTLVERVDATCRRLNLPERTATYVSAWASQRFHHEETISNANFVNRRQEHLSALPYSLAESLAHALRGDALPGEILDVGTELGMSAFELAKVSHVGGSPKEMAQLARARQTVNSAIIAKGGKLYDETDEPCWSLLGTDDIIEQDGIVTCVAMARKRLVGELPNGYIVSEKSRFIVQLDELSGIDKDSVAWLRAVEAVSPLLVIEKLAHNQAFLKAVKQALDGDNFVAVIPMNTALYASDPVMAALEKEKRLARQDQLGAARVGWSALKSANNY